MMQEHQLGGKLLAGVSRSFYLTLKALPEGIREPLSIAYLLARAADTISDTLKIPDPLRIKCLEELDRLIQVRSQDEAAEKALWELLTVEFLPLQEDASEVELLQRLPEVLAVYRTFPPAQIALIAEVMRTIIRGQRLDIERFPFDAEFRALHTAEELDEYTYLVAGSVGKFWTQLCVEVLPNTFHKDAHLDELIECGIRYGKGLQLINILRDTGKDGQLGRCYFPEEELREKGVTLADLKMRPEVIAQVTPKWQTLCAEHLECGLRYVESLRSWKLRYATALPLLIGIRTLNLVGKADSVSLVKGVKITRGEVIKLMLTAAVVSLWRGGVRRLADSLKK